MASGIKASHYEGMSSGDDRAAAKYIGGGKRQTIRICRVVTVSQTFQTLLHAQLRSMTDHGLDVTLVCNTGPELAAIANQVGAKFVGVPLQRQPAPLADSRSLFRLARVFQRNHFDIIHSSTPKAGFLTAIAARIAGAHIRLHTFTGQPWVELTGLRRIIPKECDRITAMLATRCYADSPSQRDFLVKEGLVFRGKISVLGAGSISGVDLQRFDLATWGGERALQTRRELGISGRSLVIIFVGRLTKDKGIAELVSAFDALTDRIANLHLVLVGPFEPDRDPLPSETLERIRDNPRIHSVGFSRTPEKYLAASDIFCLPSYREGFGSVVVEAAAMGLPSVITQVTGLIDAVVEGETGLIVPPKNAHELAKALGHLCASIELRHTLGQKGKRRVEREFSATRVNEAMVAEYYRLANRCIPK